MSRAMVRTGICNIPSAIQRFVDHQYALKVEDGSLVGSLSRKGSYFTGLAQFFARRGGEPEDYLVVVLDQRAHEATPLIGDESLLEKFRGRNGSA